MNQKIYKSIKKKMVNNIKIIYGNKTINEELIRITKSNPYLIDISKTLTDNALAKYESYLIDDDGNITQGNRGNSLSHHLLTILSEYALKKRTTNKKEKIKNEKIIKYLNKILTHKKEDIFDRICRKNKYNPSIWRDFFILRFLGLTINDAYRCLNNIIYHNYLPKPFNLGNKLLIEINELTTQEEIKFVWKEIELAQHYFEKLNSIKNQKREFKTFSRGKEIIERMEGKLKFIDFSEKTKKVGYKKNGNLNHDEESTYPYKLKRNFKKKYIER